MGRFTEPDLIFVHNPFAQVPLPQRWGPWDREFVAVAEGGNWTVSDILRQPG